MFWSNKTTQGIKQTRFLSSCCSLLRTQPSPEWWLLHVYISLLLLLRLINCFSHVWLCVTPQTAAHQGPPPLGFSRQEHWSGLPFPSPMYESEKWKWSCSVVSHSSRPHGLQPTRLLRPWNFPGKSTGVGCHCLLRHFPTSSWQMLLLIHHKWRKEDRT